MQGALNAYEYNGAEQLRRDLGASVALELSPTATTLIGKAIVATAAIELTVSADMRRARPVAARVEAEISPVMTLSKLSVSSRGATIRRPYQGRSMRRVQSTREPTR